MASKLERAKAKRERRAARSGGSSYAQANTQEQVEFQRLAWWNETELRRRDVQDRRRSEEARRAQAAAEAKSWRDS